MKSDKEIYYKNRGVERNKKPLQNIHYKVTVHDIDLDVLSQNLTADSVNEFLEKYQITTDKYIRVYSSLNSPAKRGAWGWNSRRTVSFMKEILTQKQWQKFMRKVGQGETEYVFTVQRRVNGKNVSKTK